MSTPTDHTPLPPSAKGFPAEAVGMPLAEIAGQGWSIHERFSTPLAVISEPALHHNIERMALWSKEVSVELWPHAKTTMTPAIFHRQLATGAVGMSAATVTQVRAMRATGVPRILLANQLIQRAEARWVAEQLACDDAFEMMCLIDSVTGVEILEEAAARTGATFKVVIELGLAGGRAGCRTDAEVQGVVAAIEASAHVSLVGVGGYEEPAANLARSNTETAVRAFLSRIRGTAERLVAEGYLATPAVLTAGGSAYFDHVATELGPAREAGWARLLVRSGCYTVHDSGVNERNSPLANSRGATAPLQAALSVWTTVLSRPDPNLALLDIGRRDVSFDHGHPVVIYSRDHSELMGTEVDRLNDQHGYLPVSPEVQLMPGDRLELGISHPCTTFDKWRFIPIVDRNGVVIEVATTQF